jgi:pimeloyl-ACP methyl ester carboxylesterase
VDKKKGIAAVEVSLRFCGQGDRTRCCPSLLLQRLDGVSSHAKRKIYRCRRHSHPLVRSRFLPHLARQKDETLGIIRDRGLGKPTLLAWSYQDPTASIDQGYALFDLITRSTPDARMYTYNRSGHFCYREHPAEFNEMLRSFIGRNS